MLIDCPVSNLTYEVVVTPSGGVMCGFGTLSKGSPAPPSAKLARAVTTLSGVYAEVFCDHLGPAQIPADADPNTAVPGHINGQSWYAEGIPVPFTGAGSGACPDNRRTMVVWFYAGGHLVERQRVHFFAAVGQGESCCAGSGSGRPVRAPSSPKFARQTPPLPPPPPPPFPYRL
jgi:hypothetical protein